MFVNSFQMPTNEIWSIYTIPPYLSLPVFLFHLSTLSFSLSLSLSKWVHTPDTGYKLIRKANVTWSSNIGFFFFTFYSIRVIESLILSTCPTIFVSFRIFFIFFFFHSLYIFLTVQPLTKTGIWKMLENCQMIR